MKGWGRFQKSFAVKLQEENFFDFDKKHFKLELKKNKNKREFSRGLKMGIGFNRIQSVSHKCNYIL